MTGGRARAVVLSRVVSCWWCKSWKSKLEKHRQRADRTFLFPTVLRCPPQVRWLYPFVRQLERDTNYNLARCLFRRQWYLPLDSTREAAMDGRVGDYLDFCGELTFWGRRRIKLISIEGEYKDVVCSDPQLLHTTTHRK